MYFLYIFVTLLITHDLNSITFWNPPSAWSCGIHSFIPLPVSFDVVTLQAKPGGISFEDEDGGKDLVSGSPNKKKTCVNTENERLRIASPR